MLTCFLPYQIILPASLLLSCTDRNNDREATIERVWQFDTYSDSISFYKRAGNIDENEYGFQFLSDGKLKVRQNVGWCGTPPITYETVSGSWNKMSDSTIRLDYPYWGGKIVEDLMIIKISNTALQTKSVKLQMLE